MAEHELAYMIREGLGEDGNGGQSMWGEPEVKRRGKMRLWPFCWQKDSDEVHEIERSSIDDGSQFSLSLNVLPSLGARSTRKAVTTRFIISPFDSRYRTWDSYLVFLVFYSAWVSPLEFGFLQKPIKLLAITDNIVNGFFFVDIVLTFFVAYLDKQSYLLIDDHKKIAWRYVSSWFAFDLISTVPSELVQKVVPTNMQFYGLFNMLRLWRLRRVSRMFSSVACPAGSSTKICYPHIILLNVRLEKDRNVDYLLIRVVKLALVTLFSLHIAACFYYYIGATYPDPKKTWIGTEMDDFQNTRLAARYVATLYWSITTMSTTGYGDLHAVNGREMLFTVVYMIFNLGLTSYIIGNMTNLVVHGTTRTLHFRDSIEAASSFAQRNHLPVRLQDQMLSHLCLKYRTDSEGLQQQEVLESLPKAIRSSIASHLFYSVLDKVYLFSGVSNDLLFQLVSEMKPEYFPPKEDVILRNEAPTDFYVLVTGAVEMIALKNGGEQVITEARTGDIFGEIGVLCCRPQIFTVRTKRLCQLLRLNRSVFLSLVQANVGDGAIIMSNLLEHLKQLQDPLMQSVLQDIETMLARGRMEVPLTLWFAASRGDEALMHHLLKRGVDPNEPDNDGRSALHTVAANGNEGPAIILLEAGANPNNQDSEGNVPLWEAILGGHKAMVKLLLENGAVLPQAEMGQYVCYAAELNNLELLKDLVECGGDVSVAKNNGTTALHIAVSDGHVEMARFLLEQGADPDAADIHGWTPRGLADYHDNVEMKEMLQSKEGEKQKVSGINDPPMRLKKLKLPKGLRKSSGVTSTAGRQTRRRVCNFQSSFFGIMSAAARGETMTSAEAGTSSTPVLNMQPTRVVVKCPEKSDTSKLIFLPETMVELLDLGGRKFRCSPTKVLTAEGAEVEEIELIRDGELLIFVTEDDRDTSSPSSL